jgi:hypothetical protein
MFCNKWDELKMQVFWNSIQRPGLRDEGNSTQATIMKYRK